MNSRVSRGSASESKSPAELASVARNENRRHARKRRPPIAPPQVFFDELARLAQRLCHPGAPHFLRRRKLILEVNTCRRPRFNHRFHQFVCIPANPRILPPRPATIGANQYVPGLLAFCGFDLGPRASKRPD